MHVYCTSSMEVQRIMEEYRVMRSYLNKVILIATDGLTKELCIGAYLFASTVVRLGRKSGWLHVALYFKQCASSLMTAYGGVKTPPQLLPVPVSLTRSGYPIPSFHRIMMYVKDSHADLLVKLYLSFFSLSKRILLAKKIKTDTFKSIICSWDNPDEVVSWVGHTKMSLKPLIQRYMPLISTIPPYQGMSWDPT